VSIDKRNKSRGRPQTKKRADNPNVGTMVITKDLKELLVSEKRRGESFADCAYRLIWKRVCA